MNQPESLWMNQPNFEAAYKEISDYYHEKGLTLQPLYTQDGSEIHPKLSGVTFNFWGKPGVEESKIVVNFEGPEDEDTIQLTGGVYNSFSEAKVDLRMKAQEIFSNYQDGKSKEAA